MWWNWHQNWCSKAETGTLFGQIVKNILHTHKAYRAVTIDLCTMPLMHWYFNYRLCCVHSYLWWYHGKIKYNTITQTRLHIYFNINFDATFTTSSQSITRFKYIQINALDFPTCEKCDFKFSMISMLKILFVPIINHVISSFVKINKSL